MRAIILAAGQGTRLRPLTDERPKCMVEYRGKAIVDYILEALRAADVTDIVVVKGFKQEKLVRAGVRSCLNAHYATTNMVESLFAAESELSGDIIVSYSDIVYGPQAVRALLQSQHDFSVVVDRDWRELWNARMENPLTDAETLKVDDAGRIIELGKKPKSFDEIHGQYIGLFKISARVIGKVREFYHALDRSARYDGKDFGNMYMTSFIQLVIDRLMPVHATFIHGGWLEIDQPSDLEVHVRIDGQGGAK